MKAPHDCATMAELRQSIDTLDRNLVEILAKRFAYIDRAAELKSATGLPARVPERVDEVLANIRAHATELGLDPDLLERFWRDMIEASIAREENLMGRDCDV